MATAVGRPALSVSAEDPRPGERRVIDGRERVYYDGYWIKAYTAPADTLDAKKRLIEALTRRLFNHVEHGLNIPGNRLAEARRALEGETDPRRRRVKAGMLAGALFNRATDIFKKLVELQAMGVEIQSDNALMRECGAHLQEALALGKMVLHRSGEEGIDELWGEPFKAFAFPVDAFYTSRYIKIAQAMRSIDEIRDELSSALDAYAAFEGVQPLLSEFAAAARAKCETLRTDPDIFDVWASFVVAGEQLLEFPPALSAEPSAAEQRTIAQGLRLMREGYELITSITRARVIMPKSTAEYLSGVRRFRGDAPASKGNGAAEASRPG